MKMMDLAPQWSAEEGAGRSIKRGASWMYKLRFPPTPLSSTYLCISIHACIHMHAYIHTYVRTYMHTYMRGFAKDDFQVS